MEDDNFIYDNAADVSFKLLGPPMQLPFDLKMDVVDNALIIVPNKQNIPLSYKLLGFDTIPYYKILLSDIRYYHKDGEIISTTSGSGGGSGYSIVTGWNSKVHPINITTEITDTKYTGLYYNENGKDVMLSFQYDDFHKFKKLLPLKDYQVTQSELIKQLQDNDYSSHLTVLKKLYDENLISESDFKEKAHEIMKRL